MTSTNHPPAIGGSDLETLAALSTEGLLQVLGSLTHISFGAHEDGEQMLKGLQNLAWVAQVLREREKELDAYERANGTVNP